MAGQAVDELAAAQDVVKDREAELAEAELAAEEAANASDEARSADATRKVRAARDKRDYAKDVYQGKWSLAKARLKKHLFKAQGNVRQSLSKLGNKASTHLRQAQNVLESELEVVRASNEQAMLKMKKKLSEVHLQYHKATSVPGEYFQLQKALKRTSDPEERQAIALKMQDLEDASLDHVQSVLVHAGQLFLIVFFVLGCMYSIELEEKGEDSPVKVRKSA